MFARSLFINLPLLQSIPKRELLLLFSETWRGGGDFKNGGAERIADSSLSVE